jgi:thiol-disulfide isomerase/thioredoxin
MASNKRSTKRRPTRPVQSNENGPRRLGGQPQPQQRSASAQRRYERSRRSRRSSGLTAWAGVLVVVVVVLAFAIYKLTEHTPAASKSGSNLALAPASVVSELKSIPASTFNAVGTDKSSDPFTETAKQPFIRLDGKPHVVYVGAEYCPYCAVTRWTLVIALSRFGTFTNLHQTTSSADVAPIPTFSFVGSKYTSDYITFTPYEESDRNGNPLDVPPKSIEALLTRYDGSATKASKFNDSGTTGIPFIDVANQHVLSGAPAILDNSIPDVAGGGPGGFNGIAYAIAHPSSATGKAIQASGFIAVANYEIAEICNVDGGKPGSVCQMTGVKAAAKAIASQKKLS